MWNWIADTTKAKNEVTTKLEYFDQSHLNYEDLTAGCYCCEYAAKKHHQEHKEVVNRFICDTFTDADGNCKEECIFKNDNDCCTTEFWSCETDIDYLISKVEDFKNKYMKEHYSETLISWFKRRFPESSEQICDLLCPKFVFGEEISFFVQCRRFWMLE